MICSSRPRLLAFSIGLLSAAMSAAAQAAARPSVIELFTSQGCSSCPPAEALLGELKLSPNVLALAFHVTYWDELGWADRFALPFADQRQSRYAHALNLSSVFTPQVIVDGRRSFVGSDRDGILRDIAGERPGVGIAIEAAGAELQIDVAAAASPASITGATMNTTPARGEVLLLALLPEAQTAIGRGETVAHCMNSASCAPASRLAPGMAARGATRCREQRCPRTPPG